MSQTFCLLMLHLAANFVSNNQFQYTLLFCNYTTLSFLMQVPQHRHESQLVIWRLCMLYKAFYLFHVHSGTFPGDLIPTTLMILRNTRLVMHENLCGGDGTVAGH